MDKNEVLEILKTIKYPGFDKNIVDFKIVKDVKIEYSMVLVELSYKGENQDNYNTIVESIKSALSPHFREVYVKNVKESKKKAQNYVPEKLKLPVKKMIAITSGKGGVGKTTVTVNLAVALSKLGVKTGILDLDLFGPNVPLLLNAEEYRPEVVGKDIMPIKTNGIEIMSLYYMASSDQAVLWKGPMQSKAVEELASFTKWSCDVLFVDLPPGTGDIMLTVGQKLPMDYAIAVTLPTLVSMDDTSRSIQTFSKLKVNVMGIIENMTEFICPNCDKRIKLFEGNAADRLAVKFGIDILGRIPADPGIYISEATGIPVVSDDSYPSSKVYIKIAEKIKNILQI
jgi:ATP-binding protein involved in chromosome partitioning